MRKVLVLAAALVLVVGFVSAPDKHGPQRTAKFVVEFEDDKVAGWKTVTIPAVAIEQGNYREGNEAPHEKKVAGQPSFDDLEMERGVKIGDKELQDWIEDVRAGKADEGRKEIAVVVMDTEGNAQLAISWPNDYPPPRSIEYIEKNAKDNENVLRGRDDVDLSIQEKSTGQNELASYEWRVDGQPVSTAHAFDSSDGTRFTVTDDDGAADTSMNKGELIDNIASEADISKADAKRALDAFIERSSDGSSTARMQHTIGEIQTLLKDCESKLCGKISESAEVRDSGSSAAEEAALAGDRKKSKKKLRKVRGIVEEDIEKIEGSLKEEKEDREVLEKVLKKEKKLLEQTDNAMHVVEHENLWVNDGSGGFDMKTVTDDEGASAQANDRKTVQPRDLIIVATGNDDDVKKAVQLIKKSGVRETVKWFDESRGYGVIVSGNATNQRGEVKAVALEWATESGDAGEYSARKDRNPQTGKEIKIPAGAGGGDEEFQEALALLLENALDDEQHEKKVTKFKPGKNLAEKAK